MSAEELHELLSILAATPVEMQRLLENISAEHLRGRPAEGEFSCLETVCHLRDIEVEGYTPRIKRILMEDRPLLSDIDGGRLARERDYNQQDVHEALRVFARARTASASVLTNLGPEELSRKGTLEGVGDVRLEDLLMMMRDHDAGHLKDIERILQSDLL